MNILLIEDNLAEARLLHEVLKGTIHRFHLAHVKRLAEAIAQLQSQPFDVILLDLTLPDSQGLASLDSLIAVESSLPIVVLTNTNDEDLAVKAVRHGAQDYLVKRHLNQDTLVRSLRYAIERKQSEEALRDANEILELRVQERTAELETANERLRREIERRQQVQERLVLAQQAGKIGSFEWNIQSNQITWSTELEALYCVPTGTFGDRHDPWLQTLHAADRPHVETELWQAIRAGHGLDTEFRINCPIGERWIAIKSNLFYDSDNQPQRMIGIHMDITEKKQLEAQFLRAQRLESLGTLASGIAHDLNNILTPILAIVQLLPLKVPNLNDQTRHMLQTLETSAHRGAGLVKQILSFARGVEGNRVHLQVNHLLREVETIIQQTIPKSITVQTDIPSNLLPILGDATQLHQVLMNLCVNARDAMPNGGTLRLSAENVVFDDSLARQYLDATVGPYIVITVSDTGVGIPSHIMHQIFDPFFTTKDVGQGTGLGLSAVLGIVKGHGGFVDVKSEPDQGSQFQIGLPACQSSSVVVIDDVEYLRGQQQLVLVVDDEQAIRDITQTTLETYGYRVLTARDGLEAMSILAEHHDEVAAVLIDIMMPSFDGLSTIPLLYRFNPNLTIVAMSGLSAKETVAQAEQLGVHHFLPKPFSTTDLLRSLQSDRGS